jgi:hypothetical protein
MPAYIVLDSEDPERLTEFYCKLQGVEVRLTYADGRYTALGGAGGGRPWRTS